MTLQDRRLNSMTFLVFHDLHKLCKQDLNLGLHPLWCLSKDLKTFYTQTAWSIKWSASSVTNLCICKNWKKVKVIKRKAEHQTSLHQGNCKSTQTEHQLHSGLMVTHIGFCWCSPAVISKFMFLWFNYSNIYTALLSLQANFFVYIFEDVFYLLLVKNVV